MSPLDPACYCRLSPVIFPDDSRRLACSGSTRTARSRSDVSIFAPLAHASVGPLQRHSRCGFRGGRHGLRGPRGDVDQRRSRARDAGTPFLRPCPFGRSVERRNACRRALRSETRPRLLRRKHVQPDARCVEGCFGLARGGAWRFTLLDPVPPSMRLRTGAISIPRNLRVVSVRWAAAIVLEPPSRGASVELRKQPRLRRARQVA